MRGASSSTGRHWRQLLLAMVVATLAAAILHVGIGGSIHLSPATTVRQILAGPTGLADRDNWIIWQLRLPRLCVALLVGAALGVSGSALQALFRNPLAEPYTVGVSSGAAVGGVLAQLFGWVGVAWGLGMPLMGFSFGIASLLGVTAIARVRGRIDTAALLLAGVVAGGFLASILSLALLAAGSDTNNVLRWLMGSLTLADWPKTAMIASVVAPCTTVLLTQGRNLNALATGEDAAAFLGIELPRLMWIVLLASTAMVAVAVGTVGVIGFVGLMAPHIARRVLGVDWRRSMLGATVLGMLLMVAADLAAQRAMPNGELPVGAITAVLGAPFLLVLLRRA